jgi:hypothetical protein
MQKAPRFILILGLLGKAASLFNYFNAQIDWYINLFSLVGSLGLVVAYFHTKKSLAEKED